MIPENFYFKYILFLIGSFVFSMLMNRLFLRFVKTLGIRNISETVIRWSNESKPALGGITFFIVFLMSGALYPLFFGNADIVYEPKSLGILAATSIGFIMGLADDAYNTRPILKSVTQFACALILVYSGTQIEIFSLDIINKILTIIWVVGIMNSLNMLDNMDGITGSVAASICLAIISISLMHHMEKDLNFIIISGTFTAILAFLYYNWYPSKMYMGDSGSQFLGIVLSAMGIIYFWNPINNLPSEVSLSKQLLLPLLCFLVPIIDTTTVTINRLRKGNSPFIGGKDHTTHYLSRAGLGDKNVAIIVVLLSLVSALLVFCITTFILEWKINYFFIFISYSILIFAILFSFTKEKKKQP